MNKQEKTEIISLDEYDQSVSLYQLIPSGSGLGIRHLKAITDSIFNSPIKSNKPLSVLIAGQQGCRTHARSFIRALGLEFINEFNANQLQATYSTVSDLFNPLLTCDSYIINSVDLLHSSILTILCQIMTKGQYSLNNHYSNTQEITAVYHPLIMTSQNKKKIPDYITEKIDHIVEIEEYNDQQLILVVLQRLKYCKIDYENEKLLQYIVLSGDRDLQCMIRLLKTAITVMLADSRKTLTIKDVKRAVRF